jgi:DHA2 family methylenomycin A resistance protein-like MFS transporter
VSRSVAALVLGSSLVTLDGTAVTLTIPPIAQALEMRPSSLHWLSDAPLLALAVLLLPAGALGDRRGHLRVMRYGLVIFAAGAALAAVSASVTMLVAARVIQGIGAAGILPSAFAVVRAAIDEPEKQARKFGLLAAWTGAAAVAGPLIGGVLADVVSWRAVFGVSTTVALIACGGLWRAGEVAAPSQGRMLPPQLLRTRNCVGANLATFGLYFGVFGLPFVIVIYVQEVLGYSALLASLVILPLSIMMFFAAKFARLSARVGSKRLVLIGSVIAAAGAAWMAAPVGHLPVWASIITGTALFGLGVSIAVSPMTQAAISGVGASCAGAASALNHAVVRGAGLAGIALLGAVGGACGVTGALLLRDEEPGVL